MRKKLLALVGLSVLPMLSMAQTSADSPRFYLGAGASVLTSRPFSLSDHPLASPMLTVGAWLRPRLALQISGSAIWSTNDPSYSDSPVPPVNSNGNKLTVYTLPVLLRFAFLAPDKRFNIDALGGYTLLHSNSVFSMYNSSSTQSVITNRSMLTLGPSFRYLFSQHLGATLAPLLNVNLNDTHHLSLQQNLLCNYTGAIYYSFN